MRIVHRYQSEQMNLELSVSDDKLKLFAKVVPQPKHTEVSNLAITEELLKVTLENLIDCDVVRDITEQLRAGKGCEGRRVAKGEPPIPGKDGKIVWEIFGKKGRYDAGKNRAEIEEPRLNVNRENGETVNLTAKRADIELTGTEILKAELFDDVVVVHNRETTIKTDRAIYIKATETIDMPNYVQAENPIFTMNGKKLHGNITNQTITITGGVRSTFKPRRKRKR
jgi:LPS export ABC transporter protein LptC